MLEEELVLGGCGLGDPKVPEFWISHGVPCPPQQSPFQQKHLGYLDQGGPGKESPTFRLPAALWSRGDGANMQRFEREL